jgi:alpha-galactosidase
MVNQWRSFSENYYGDYYPLTPYNLSADDWIAWQFDRPEARQGMVQAFRRDRSAYESARFKLKGLAPDARYSISNLDAATGTQEVTGRDLMESGLLVPISARPGSTTILYTRFVPP